MSSTSAAIVALFLSIAPNRLLVELNPFLNKIAREAASFLGVSNVEFSEADFVQTELDRKFDVILSFSNHHTIDGNLGVSFDRYIEKIVNLLKPGGYLLFESHDVFGPGKGRPGDDGDMDKKVAILNKFFDIERYKMVRCYLGHGWGDIDKLFIVARLSQNPKPTSFSLEAARKKYEY